MVDRKRKPRQAVDDDIRMELVMSPAAQDVPVTSKTAEDEDAEFERQLTIGRRVMRKHRNVLAALAK